MVREIYPLRETLTKNFEVNSTNVTENNDQTNKQTNIRTDKRKDENYIPLSINAGGIMKEQLQTQNFKWMDVCMYINTHAKMIISIIQSSR